MMVGASSERESHAANFIMRKLPVEEIVVPLILAVVELLILGFALMGGSVAFAMIGSMADGLLSMIGASTSPMCQRGGWFLGVVLGGVGYWKSGWRRLKSYFEHWHPDYQEQDETSEDEPTDEEDDGKRTIDIDKLKGLRETATAIGMTIFLGIFAGGMAACYAVLVWFSISYSPVAPAGWMESIEPASSVDDTEMGIQDEELEGYGVSSSHPTLQQWAAYCFVIVASLVSTGGTLLCLVCYFRNSRR